MILCFGYIFGYKMIIIQEGGVDVGVREACRYKRW